MKRLLSMSGDRPTFEKALDRKIARLREVGDSTRPRIVIYQMGKVGSLTIRNSLCAAGIDENVYHVHALVPSLIDDLKERYRVASEVYGKVIVDSHLAESCYLREILDQGTLGPRWKVITVIRDPVARNVSSFFQAFRIDQPRLALQYKRNAVDMRDHFQELSENFFREFNHERPLIWYDQYFKPIFGIDVYATPFSHDLRYCTYQSNFADCLLIRLEDLNDVGETVLADFLNRPGLALENANVSDDKDYGETYRKFRRELQFSDAYLDHIYQSKFVRHFYRETEIAGMRARWARPSADVDGMNASKET